MSIVMYPDPVLRQVAEPVEHFDDALKDLGADLLDACKAASGLAVAAPQIGVSKAVCVYEVPKPLQKRYGYGANMLVNPSIIAASDETWMFNEGCLSIPDKFWYISRPATVTVEYYDVRGNRQWMTESGLLGRMLQHEIDHLNGRLIVDLLTKNELKKLERELAA